MNRGQTPFMHSIRLINPPKRSAGGKRSVADLPFFFVASICQQKEVATTISTSGFGNIDFSILYYPLVDSALSTCRYFARHKNALYHGCSILVEHECSIAMERPSQQLWNDRNIRVSCCQLNFPNYSNQSNPFKPFKPFKLLKPFKPLNVTL